MTFHKSLLSLCKLLFSMLNLERNFSNTLKLRNFFFLDTSRAPREGEIHGKGYYFTDRETMDIDIKEDAFLEYGEFNGNIYGTKLETIHSVIHSGKMCVLDVNPTVSIWFSF